MQKGTDLRPHIGIFGKRNAGKSSLINMLTGQEIAIVSDVAGTTTDSVKKTMEMKGVGPVVLIDTAGIDDTGNLGDKRVEKTLEVVNIIDLALIVITENNFKEETEIIEQLQKKNVPFVLVYNKMDIQPLKENLKAALIEKYKAPVLEITTKNQELKVELTKNIQELLPESAYKPKSLLGDVIEKQSFVLLVVPIDSAAPQGRLILPQVQLIRDILDNNSIAVVCKETELEYYMQKASFTPDLVVVDSQIFGYASKIVPNTIPLTSFSIVLAKAKGLFKEYLEGTLHIDQLKENDRILLLESCTHQTTCEDIGRVKIPALFKKYTGKNLQFEIVSGLQSLPRPIKEYAMVIQCGGCMITGKQLINRILPAVEVGVPISNYGMVIAFMHGIFERGIQIFKK